MPGFYYYLPQLTKDRVARDGQLDLEVLATIGLREVLADVVNVPKHASVSDVGGCKGPDGGNGCIISVVSKHERLPAIGNAPGRQTWRPRGDGKQVWLGIWSEAPPTPLCLERWQLLPGYSVSDQHGNEWRVPIARSPDPEWLFGTLPQCYVFDAAGEPRGQLDTAWQWLYDLAGEIRHYYAKDTAPSDEATLIELGDYQQPPFSWLVKAAARILQVNYRLGWAEVNFLQELGQSLLTQTTVYALTRALIHYETVAAAPASPVEPTPADVV